jgi:hypothetical protein
LPLNRGETGSGEGRSKKDKAGLGTCGLSLGEYSYERNGGAEDDNRLKTDRSHDPFQDIGLELGKPRFEPRLEVCQIHLCGKIALRPSPKAAARTSACSAVKWPFSRRVRERRRVSKRMAFTGAIWSEAGGKSTGAAAATASRRIRAATCSGGARPTLSGRRLVRIQIFGAAQRTISRITWPRAASNAAATAKGSLEGDATLAENSRPAMMRPLV